MTDETVMHEPVKVHEPKKTQNPSSLTIPCRHRMCCLIMHWLILCCLYCPEQPVRVDGHRPSRESAGWCFYGLLCIFTPSSWLAEVSVKVW